MYVHPEDHRPKTSLPRRGSLLPWVLAVIALIVSSTAVTAIVVSHAAQADVEISEPAPPLEPELPVVEPEPDPEPIVVGEPTPIVPAAPEPPPRRAKARRAKRAPAASEANVLDRLGQSASRLADEERAPE